MFVLELALVLLLLGACGFYLVTRLRRSTTLPLPPANYRHGARRVEYGKGWTGYVLREPGNYARLRRVDMARWGKSLRVTYGFRPSSAAEERTTGRPVVIEVVEVREEEAM